MGGKVPTPTPIAKGRSTVRIAGDDFAVYSVGPADASTVLVCFHGLGLSAHSWLPFADKVNGTQLSLWSTHPLLIR